MTVPRGTTAAAVGGAASNQHTKTPADRPPPGRAGALGREGGYCFHDELEKRGGRRRLQQIARGILPENKGLACCGKAPNKRGLLDAWKRPEGVQVWAGEKRAYFRGLHTCGSVWLCPVCAAKISEGRKKEVQTAIDNGIEAGKGVVLVTLTFRHGLLDPLQDTLSKFSKALRRFKSGRKYDALKKSFGIEGEIRALEVTHGANGWHPHTHALTFSRSPIRGHQLTRYRRRLFVLWYAACRREGLPLPSYAHGVDVRAAKYAADYVAKWGFACELAKPGQKGGRGGGRTPWELLADAGAGDKRAAWLFREYAKYFRGKRQLFWSVGLAVALNLGRDEMTEQQLLELHEDEAPRLVATIDLDTWALVQKSEAFERVLAAAYESRAALLGFLNNLRCTVPHYGGEFFGTREDWES